MTADPFDTQRAVPSSGQQPGPNASPPGSHTYCRACGRPLDPRAAFCPHDGVPQAGPYGPTPPPVQRPMLPPPAPTQKSSGLAIFLHFIFPGAGHVYAGIGDRATGYLIASTISFLLWFTLFGIPIAIVTWIVCFAMGLGDVQRAIASYNQAIGAPELRPPGF